MSDNEYEKFEITDYDLEHEFNPLRPQRRLTKNQQIYGIWAKDDSDEEEQNSRFKTTRGVRNYSAPIGFVAGGVQQAGKNKPEKAKDEDEEEDEEVTRVSDSSDEEVRVVNDRKGGLGLKVTFVDGEIAGLRKKSHARNVILAERGLGEWEKHTKGIGAKLLLQMGYQPGKGLGKNLQGIQAPIEATKRKSRETIGFYGPEKKQTIAELKLDPSKSDPSKGERLSQWRKGEGSKKKKVKYVYKSIEEVLDQGSQPGLKQREFNELSKVKVIDMTGPEQRVLSGYHAISGAKRPTDQWELRKEKKFSNFDMPELQHNLNLVLDMCEQEIIANDRKLKYNEDRMVALEAEVATLEKVKIQEEKTISGLEKVLNVVESLVKGSEKGSITLDELALAYEALKEDHFQEYLVYELANMAPAVLKPLLKTELAKWDPLQSPLRPFPIFKKWKSILGTEQTLGNNSLQDPFSRVLWESWMPCIRECVNHKWKHKDPDPLIEVLKSWEHLIPSWIMENILQQLILPKIQQAVEDWNPLTDEVPIHSWTHPWIPILEKRLQVSVFPVIRQKLAIALRGWHPSDVSPKLMLTPWVNVFTRSEMDTFLIQNIVPKLALLLQEMNINPHQQSLEIWTWVMEWCGMIPDSIMADLLHKSFFPKWLQMLTIWLNMNPNYDEVTKWYSGWKELVPARLRSQSLVKDHFRTALDLMSRSVNGPVIQPPPAAPHVEPPPVGRFQGMMEAARSSSQMIDGFKDLIQKRCEERGIIFMPIPNRYKEGKQIYRCGGHIQVYIDRNVLFCSDSGSSWIPLSIQGLLDKVTRE